MRKTKTLVVLGLMFLLALGGVLPMAAQTQGGDTGTYNQTRDNDGPDFGWLGLLGLVGLLGLRRRDPYRDTGRTTTPAR